MGTQLIDVERLSYDHYRALMEVDQDKVGSAQYAGIAYFWAYEYRHPMRDASFEERREVHHAFLAAGLKLDGESKKHLAIIKRLVRS